MLSNPIGGCDYCHRIYYGGESILRIKNNTVHDLFKLEICNSECHSNLIKEFPFISIFTFDKYIVKVKDSSNKELINNLLKNYKDYVLNKKTKFPKSSIEMMSEYLVIKNKKDKSALEKNYITFCRENSIFTY